mmetsp:Transcript_22340/g.63818  ORF Transcript_22340/g.63818 Transcript_22340/m.63818 type:complete len:231 (+) Transcript_22340:451-1143(+)
MRTRTGSRPSPSSRCYSVSQYITHSCAQVTPRHARQTDRQTDWHPDRRHPSIQTTGTKPRTRTHTRFSLPPCTHMITYPGVYGTYAVCLCVWCVVCGVWYVHFSFHSFLGGVGLLRRLPALLAFLLASDAARRALDGCGGAVGSRRHGRDGLGLHTAPVDAPLWLPTRLLTEAFLELVLPFDVQQLSILTVVIYRRLACVGALCGLQLGLHLNEAGGVFGTLRSTLRCHR